jgi:hypothetical protein
MPVIGHGASFGMQHGDVGRPHRRAQLLKRAGMDFVDQRKAQGVFREFRHVPRRLCMAGDAPACELRYKYDTPTVVSRYIVLQASYNA